MNLSNDFLCRHNPFCGHNSSSHDNSSAVIKQRTKGINKKDFRQLDKHVRPDNK